MPSRPTAKDAQDFLSREIDVVQVIISGLADTPPGGDLFHSARAKAIEVANARGYKVLCGNLAYTTDRLPLRDGDALLPFGRQAFVFAFLVVDKSVGRQN